VRVREAGPDAAGLAAGWVPMRRDEIRCTQRQLSSARHHDHRFAAGFARLMGPRVCLILDML